MFKLYSEWDLGEERLVFRSLESAKNWVNTSSQWIAFKEETIKELEYVNKEYMKKEEFSQAFATRLDIQEVKKDFFGYYERLGFISLVPLTVL